MKHRGQILAQAIAESGMKKSTIAKRVGVVERTLYNWIENPNVSLDDIIKVGKAINYDFTYEIPELKKLLKEHEKPTSEDSIPSDSYCIRRFAQIIESMHSQMASLQTQVNQLQEEIKSK